MNKELVILSSIVEEKDSFRDKFQINFYDNGEVNQHNLLYLSDSNPHWFIESKEQQTDRVIV